MYAKARVRLFTGVSDADVPPADHSYVYALYEFSYRGKPERVLFKTKNDDGKNYMFGREHDTDLISIFSDLVNTQRRSLFVTFSGVNVTSVFEPLSVSFSPELFDRFPGFEPLCSKEIIAIMTAVGAMKPRDMFRACTCGGVKGRTLSMVCMDDCSEHEFDMEGPAIVIKNDFSFSAPPVID